MNPRERIIAAFNHEIPDRTPTDGWFHSEVIKKLKDHYKTDDWVEVLQELGVEGWAGCRLKLLFPEFDKKATDRPGDKPWDKGIWTDERTYQDAWGVTHRLGDGDWYEQWIDGPLTTAQGPEDVEKANLPSPEQINEPEDYAEQIESLKSQNRFVRGGVPNPYKQAWNLRGMDNLLADYLINRDFLEALYDKLYELYGDMTRRMAKGGVDMISVGGDIAMQDRIIMGPEAWREVDKPRMAKLIQDCRDINPEVFFFIHSDGNITDLMDDIVEIGFNVINPIQPECMDPVQVKKRYGDRITLHGGVSLQKTLPFGSTDDVRNEVEHLIKKCGYNGGLVIFPSNVIQPDTSIENILTCFHTARDFDVASLGGKPG
ncbi:uroporphyrinogen decarboxylase family protein [Planctomycetota bacterium]